MPTKKHFLICLIIIQSTVLFSQNDLLKTKISVKTENKDINSTLDILSKKTGLYFSYDAELIDENKKITLKVKNEPLKNILNEIFDKNPEYNIVKNLVIIGNNKSFTQTDKKKPTFTEIKGKIIETEKKTPLPFVYAGISGTSTGTFTNLNGDFILKIPDSLKNPVIIISHIGYKNIKLKAGELEKNPVIKLTPVFIPIEEVIIKSKDPKKIILKFLSRIKDNYCDKPCLLTSFYREGVSAKNKIKNYSEAVSLIEKAAYKSFSARDKIKILKSRKIINIQGKDTVSVKLKNGPYDCLKLDIIKNGIDFFDYPDKYNFKLTDLVEYENENLFVVEFKPLKNGQIVPFKGKLYINDEDFALVKAEFNIDFKAKTKGINFTVKKSKNIRIKPVSAHYSVRYKKINKKYILNHVRTDVVFSIRKKHSIFNSEYEIFSETAIIKPECKNTGKLKKSETLKRNSIFINNNYEYDPDFWNEINFISPEKNIIKDLKSINAKIKSSIVK